MIRENVLIKTETDEINHLVDSYVQVLDISYGNIASVSDKADERNTGERIISGNSYEDTYGQPHFTNSASDNHKHVLSVDFNSLSEINNDITAWIYDSNAGINLPVVKTDDNSFYLDKSFNKEPGKLGTVFLDYELDIHTSDLLILYGHNMGKDRTEMFSQLRVYDDYHGSGNHSEIILSTPDGRESRWKVFAVCLVDICDDEASLYRKNDFNSAEDFAEYISLIGRLRLNDTGVLPSYGDSLLMLSTCTGDINFNRDLRRVVLAFKTYEMKER